jgi:hypothetical protein
MSEEDKGKSTKLEIFVKAASGAIGGVAGLAATIVTGEPIVGTVASPLISSLTSDMAGRLLSQREKARIGGALAFAMEQFDSNLKAGHELRSDDFFLSSSTENSMAAEVLEGALLAAQKEHEEKKIRHIGYLMANLCLQTILTNPPPTGSLEPPTSSVGHNLSFSLSSAVMTKCCRRAMLVKV